MTTDIVRGRNERNKGAGHAANAYLKAIRPLFKFAMSEGYITSNPCIGVSAVKTQKGGFHTWTIEEVARFEDHYELGTMAHLALRIFLYTGLRRGDAVKLGRQHIKSGIMELRPQKTSKSTGVLVTLPILPPLQEALDATKTGDMVFLITGHGKPFSSAASFGNWFADRCEDAGVKGRAHGLRKAGATLAAENGATVHQLMSIFGWSNIAQAEIYTSAADRKKMAIEAASRLIR